MLPTVAKSVGEQIFVQAPGELSVTVVNGLGRTLKPGALDTQSDQLSWGRPDANMHDSCLLDSLVSGMYVDKLALSRNLEMWPRAEQIDEGQDQGEYAI